jgi:carbamoyl-phosphate synthase large subunit
MGNMLKKFNVLFLGGAKRISLGERFINAGKDLNLDVSVFTYDLIKNVPFSAIGKVIKGKPWNDQNILNHLKFVIKKNNISIVLANVDKATIVLAKLNERFKNLNLISSNSKLCGIFFDKLKMQNEFEKIKLPIIPLSNKIPIFIKPRKGSASKNTCIIKNKKNLRYCLSKNSKNKFIMQKYINGIEYTVDAYISKNGCFIGAVPRIRNKVTDGESTQTTTVKNKKILNLTKKIINNFKFRGPICLQFIETKTKIYIHEKKFASYVSS